MSSKFVTETVILHSKKGVDFDTAKDSPAAQTFLLLTKTLKQQPGQIRQFWGHQVENPHLFVWIIDWASEAAHIAFIKSPQYGPFLAGVGEVFDVEVAAPVMTHTPWTPEATKAFSAHVTEVAFFTLPNGTSDEVKRKIDDALEPIGDAVQIFGKATGSCMGWASIVDPDVSTTAPSSAGKELLHGVFGYASIDVHMRWREHPEHNKAVDAFAKLHQEGVVLECANIPGIDPETGYFHVHFHAET